MMSNATSIANMTSSILQNCPITTDYLGYFLGFTAIGIAIYSYLKQKSWNNEIGKLTAGINLLANNTNIYIEEQKKIENSVRQFHLLSIINFANMAKWQLNFMINQLQQPDSNLKDLVESYGGMLKLYSENVLRHCNDLNFRIISSLYQELESIGNRIKKLSALSQLKGFPNEQEEWVSYAKDTIGIVEDATPKVYQLLGFPEPP